MNGRNMSQKEKHGHLFFSSCMFITISLVFVLQQTDGSEKTGVIQFYPSSLPGWWQQHSWLRNPCGVNEEFDGFSILPGLCYTLQQW